MKRRGRAKGPKAPAGTLIRRGLGLGAVAGAAVGLVTAGTTGAAFGVAAGGLAGGEIGEYIARKQ